MFTIIGGDGKEYGPVTVAQLRAWIAAGRANLATQARREGEAEWRPLADFAEFAPPAPGMPPPLAPVVAATADAELADRGTRLAAALLDGLFAMLCFLPAGFTIGFEAFTSMLTRDSGGEVAAANMLLGSSLFVLALFFVLIVQAVLLTRRGQSVGKMLLRIRIVRYRDGTPAGFVHAFLLRWIVPSIIGLVRYIGGLFSIVDVLFIFGREKRCLHDYIADTKVVRCDRPKP